MIVSAIAVGFTIKVLDTPTPELVAHGVKHAIGTTFPAPQATLMATLIKGSSPGTLTGTMCWSAPRFALVVELCGVRSLSFAIGVYLPLSTTLTIFCGGAIRGIVDKVKKKRGEKYSEMGEDLEKGNLFATGLVAGGALMGVIFAFLQIPAKVVAFLDKLSLEKTLTSALGQSGYYLLGVVFFVIMGYALYRAGASKQQPTF